MKDSDAWSLYWQGKPLNSCISNIYQEDQLILERCWTDFVDGLDAGSTVVDLATGNGAVLLCLAKYQTNLKYIGIDYADVSPESHFVGELSRAVSFIPKTDIANLPFESDSIDAITSQFGFEYSAIFDSANEMLRVLKPGAKFQLVLHHEDSEILKSSSRRKIELELLLLKEGLIETVQQYVEDTIDAILLERAGESFIANNTGLLSEDITGQIFTTINQIIELKEGRAESAEAKIVLDNLQSKIIAENSRLSQLSNAALSRQEVEQIMTHWSANISNIELRVIAPYQAEDKILAWLLSGKKSEAEQQ